MFDNTFFDKWLDTKSGEVISIMDKRKLTSDEMMILVLKAQSNHFHHLDVEFREEMKKIRVHSTREISLLRSDMDKRFEQVDKRFEQVDKRFEQMEKRLEQFGKMFDRSFSFMKFQTAISFAMMSGIFIKLFMG